MKNFSIKIKLIILFTIIKVIPLLLIAYIAFEGILNLNKYFSSSTEKLFSENKIIIENTARKAIEDSIYMLDKKSQFSLERVSFEISKNVADFLYERDKDILFLSKLKLNKKILKDFYLTKQREIIVHDKYYYNEKKSSWETKKEIEKDNRIETTARLKDNEREFNYTDPLKFKKKNIPIYKEVTFLDLDGNEVFKVSQLTEKLMNIKNKKNTYVNSENYYKDIITLKAGEIYVSDVIGEYVKSNIIGTFSKEKAKELNIPFEPEKHAYAGKENPNGKEFEAIVRFITPVYEKDKKVGFVSLALDHKHLMQFTDTVNPTQTDPLQDISDASVGNYAFMFNYQGKNISHARDYFIIGYDKETGAEVMPWLSDDLAKKYYAQNKRINEFLENYPKFEEQSLKKKPNLKQLLDEGNIAIDCRYLNFAPQCQGWMQVTKNGGYGSFIIYWSNVWKLTTAATIPYYTGKYANSKRGFGFITIGANVDEFHAAASETRQNIDVILRDQTNNMLLSLEKNRDKAESLLSSLLNELTLSTAIMVLIVILIALWVSNYISSKIGKLLIGTVKFSENELDYRIEVTSNDEIGLLEKSFNKMANKINYLIKEEKELNETLEKRVKKELKKQREQEQILIQQSRLAAMGEMIGNIAHQWRQPLNALGLVMQNIQIAYELDELDDEFMDKAIKKTNVLTKNMSKTIDDFRNFFKPNKTKENFKVKDSIEKTLFLLESTFRHHYINLEKELSDENMEIYGFANEFSQSLLNILTNAKDALIENKIKKPKIFIKSYIENDLIIIKVEDNAKGINTKIIDKIFEPYFTTKEEGKGTGIGLYMTKTIIETNMSGKLEVYNLKKGAGFIIKIKNNS